MKEEDVMKVVNDVKLVVEERDRYRESLHALYLVWSESTADDFYDYMRKFWRSLK